MNTTTAIQNWAIGTTPDVLQNIHQSAINIAIYDRDTNALSSEIEQLLEQEIEVRAKGTVDTILAALPTTISTQECPLMLADIKNLLHLFQRVTSKQEFRLLLATVNTNMCRKFHTDVNQLRMLCTYSGQGTLWLTEDNINQRALSARGMDIPIALNEDEIRQANTGAVLVLKGAIYPKEGSSAVVHRSPTIEETGERRLLLRIDSDDFLNF
jgi:hypothetical protein